LSRLEIGTIIDGKYEVLGRLRGGGMGEVYRVRHRHLDELRVIKVLPSEPAEDDPAAQRFRREARLACQVKHPRVATLHDFSQLGDGSFYMVWESIEGQDVGSWLREKGPFPVTIAIELAIQALAGLEAIHHAGIVHRDLSPDNLMITSDPRGRLGLKIIDLGLAKSLDERALVESSEGRFGGKLNYCSPEHVSFDPEVRPDQQSDVFSFAVVLFQMITGVLPFEPLSSTTGLVERFQGDTFLLSEHARQPIPEGLDQVLATALAVDRSVRYRAATSFREAIQMVYDPRRAIRAKREQASDGDAAPVEMDASSQPTSETSPRPMPEQTPPASARDGTQAPAIAAPADEAAPLGDDHGPWPIDGELREPAEEPTESRVDQKRRLQAMQTRELVEQYIATGQDKLARLALQTLLEVDPSYPDTDDLARRIEARSMASEEKLEGQRVFAAGVAAIDAGDEEGARRALEQLASQPTLERRLRSRWELQAQQHQLDEQVRVRRARLDDLVAQGRMDAASSELDLLAMLDVPKLVVDLYRARIRESLDTRRRVEERRSLDKRYEVALREGRWQEARNLVHLMEALRPDEQRIVEKLERVDQEEHTALRRDGVKEAIRTIEELLARGDHQQAEIALMVLARMAPDNPKTDELKQRVAAASGAPDRAP
jgi:serine/threonine-protein kinase